MLTNTCTYIKLTWDIHPLGASDHIPSTGLGTTPLSGRKDIQWSDASKTSNTIPNDAMVVLRSNSLAFEQSGLPSISPNYQSIYQALDFQKAGLSHRPTGKPHDSTWPSANGMWCRKHKSSHNQFLIQSPSRQLDMPIQIFRSASTLDPPNASPSWARSALTSRVQHFRHGTHFGTLWVE